MKRKSSKSNLSTPIPTPTALIAPIRAALTGGIRIDPDRLMADFHAVNQIGATPAGGLHRLALSNEDAEARTWLADRFSDAGLLITDDDAGNLSGTLRSPLLDAKTLLVGSHLDSVPNGGRFDGVIGVLAGLECARVLNEAQITLPFHLEVIDFTDDEGTWRSLFGARALAGVLSELDVFDIERDNAPFRAALTRAGIDPASVFKARRDPASLVGYLELHIEQGERLARANTEIGIVIGVVGRKQFEITFTGQAGHAGTTDMYKRRDALRGAADFIVRTHTAVRDRYGDGIFNCGNIEVQPGAANVIPSKAHLLVECRHLNDALLDAMATDIVQIARSSAAANGLEVALRTRRHMHAAGMDSHMIATLEDVCDDLGVSHVQIYSYSGHSAQYLSALTPCGTIFVPSVNGISHHPDEFTAWEDVVNGANVLLRAILRIAANSSD